MKNIMYQTIALALGTILIMGCSEEEETPPTDDTGAADVTSDAEGSGDVPETDTVEDAVEDTVADTVEDTAGDTVVDTDEIDVEDDSGSSSDSDDGSDTGETDVEDDNDGSDSDEQ